MAFFVVVTFPHLVQKYLDVMDQVISAMACIYFAVYCTRVMSTASSIQL